MKKEGVLAEYIPLLDSIKTRIRRAQVRATLSANAEMLLLYWDVGRIVTERQTVEGWGAGVVPRLAVDIKNDMPEIKGFSERNIKLMIRFYREYSLLGVECLPNHPIMQTPFAQLTESSSNDSIRQTVFAQLAESSSNDSIRPAMLTQLSESSPNRSISPTVSAKIEAAEAIRLEMLQKFALLLPWGHHVLLMEKVKDFSVRLWYMKESVEPLRSALPSIEQIETEFAQRLGENAKKGKENRRNE